MASKARFLFLGSGSSMGIPMVACGCCVCRSSFPRNRRLRPSGLLEAGKRKILFDVGPDFRRQALNCSLSSLDAVLLTHPHSDHTSGLDELRAFYILRKTSIPCFLSKSTYEDLRMRFYYLFSDNGGNPKNSSNLTAQIRFRLFEGDRGEVSFLGMRFKYFTYSQGKMLVTGYRFSDFAYLTDIKEYPESIFEDLEGVKNLVIGAPCDYPCKMHLSIDEAVAFSRKVSAEYTWITHISHAVEHKKRSISLPSNVFLAYDGLELKWQVKEQDIDE